jgi:hypothetical protein
LSIPFTDLESLVWNRDSRAGATRCSVNAPLLNFNILFRWFVGLVGDDRVWDPTVYTKNGAGFRSSRAAEAGPSASLDVALAPIDDNPLEQRSARGGQINRLKVIKRQTYGRAGFELLKARVLPLEPLSTC